MPQPTQKLAGLRIKQQALYIMIFSFITVAVWIVGSLFSSQKKTGIAPDLLELAKPLSPTVNSAVFDQIQQSTAYTDEELSYFSIYKVIKNKDGSERRIVPIDSGIDEVPNPEPSPQPDTSQQGSGQSSPFANPGQNFPGSVVNQPVFDPPQPAF